VSGTVVWLGDTSETKQNGVSCFDVYVIFEVSAWFRFYLTAPVEVKVKEVVSQPDTLFFTLDHDNTIIVKVEAFHKSRLSKRTACSFMPDRGSFVGSAGVDHEYVGQKNAHVLKSLIDVTLNHNFPELIRDFPVNSRPLFSDHSEVKEDLVQRFLVFNLRNADGSLGEIMCNHLSKDVLTLLVGMVLLMQCLGLECCLLLRRRRA